jgi:hypothetical protein
MKFNEFINQCASDSVNAEPAPQSKRKRMSRAARIRQLRVDEGMSPKDAEVWADFHDDYKTNASAR